MSLYQWIVVTFKGDTASVNYLFLIKAVPLLEILDTPLFCYINKLKCHVTRIVHGFGTNYLKKACPPTITYHPLPRTQTSPFRCARKGRREETTGATSLRPPSVPFPWSLVVHHQSLAFRARLCHAKKEAREDAAVPSLLERESCMLP